MNTPEDYTYEDLLADEAYLAEEAISQYLPEVFVFPEDDSSTAKTRACLQNLLRIQALRIEIAHELQALMNLPEGSAVLETEAHFLKIMAIQLAGDSQERRNEIASQFGVRLPKFERGSLVASLDSLGLS